MKNIFLALATVVLFFTTTPAFCVSSPSLKEVSMFADEYVGKTFTFVASISYLSKSEDHNRNYVICLGDGKDPRVSADNIYASVGATLLYVTINRKQVKEIIKTSDFSRRVQKTITFKIIKESYEGSPYYAGRVTSIQE